MKSNDVGGRHWAPVYTLKSMFPFAFGKEYPGWDIGLP